LLSAIRACDGVKTASVADDPLLNELVITEYYEVADLFKIRHGA